MSFVQEKTGIGYAPGWFLADNERCTRKTYTIAANHAEVVTAADGTKYVPMGAYIKDASNNALGILYEDVDVTTGAMPGSVVTAGTVYEARVGAAAASAKSALAAIGFKFVAVPSVTRPAGTDVGELDEITVESAAGTNSGDTALTLTGYTPGADESYVYKVGTGTAPIIGYNAIPDYTWTAWDGSSDITAATDKKITVASINSENRAVAAGSATVTAHA